MDNNQQKFEIRIGKVFDLEKREFVPEKILIATLNQTQALQEFADQEKDENLEVTYVINECRFKIVPLIEVTNQTSRPEDGEKETSSSMSDQSLPSSAEHWKRVSELIRNVERDVKNYLSAKKLTEAVADFKGLRESILNAFKIPSELMDDSLKKEEVDTEQANESKQYQRPPLGVIPKKFHQEQVDAKRLQEVCGAIERYYEDNRPINLEWIEEYNELIVKFNFETIHKGDSKTKKVAIAKEPENNINSK